MSFVKFIEGAPAPKTRRWDVWTEDGVECLGRISWWGAWRCYAFFPSEETLFEHKCLRDIADFIERRTQEQRQKKAVSLNTSPTSDK
jgi:hypothetical protein